MISNRAAETKTHLFQIMLHIVNLNTARRALQQNRPRVPRQRNGAEKDHDGDERARRRVRVEALWRGRLPDDDSRDDDAEVVYGVAHDVYKHAQHAEIAAGLLELRHVVTVLGVVCGGGLVVVFLVCCHGAQGDVGVHIVPVPVRVRVRVRVVMALVLVDKGCAEDVEA